MKGYKYKKRKYEQKYIDGQVLNNISIPTEQDINFAMAKMLVLAQVIKLQKAGEEKQ